MDYVGQNWEKKHVCRGPRGAVVPSLGCLMRTRLILMLMVFVLSGRSVWVAGENQSAGKTDFNHDIRPLLAAACFTCHGPDENKREADLRLDVQEWLRVSQQPVIRF